MTVVCAGVPVFVKWLSAPELGRHDLRSLNVLMNGGARLAPELRRRVGGVFGLAEMVRMVTSLSSFTNIPEYLNPKVFEEDKTIH